MTDPGWAVQTALLDALDGSLPYGPGSPQATAAVYDRVPDGAAYPYVTLDTQTQTSEGEPLASRRDERFFYLGVWSTYAGQKEIQEIFQGIDAALHQKRLPLTTGRMVRCYVLRKWTQRDADGETFQGQVTLRIITEH